MARRLPDIDVDPDAIFVADGNVATSAGVTAGMDLALALVEEDLGRALALEVARWLVLFVRRPGGQSQFSAGSSAQTPNARPLRELQAWIAEHLDADLSVPALAERADMSQRHFARAFRRETGRDTRRLRRGARVERARAAAREHAPPRRRGRRAVRLRHRGDHAPRIPPAARRRPRAYRERFRSPAA